MKFKYIEHRKTGRTQRVLIRRLTDKPARMQRAKGPGSYDCEADIMTLARAGKHDEARELYASHIAVRGVKPPRWAWAVALWPRRASSPTAVARHE